MPAMKVCARWPGLKPPPEAIPGLIWYAHFEAQGISRRRVCPCHDKIDRRQKLGMTSITHCAPAGSGQAATHWSWPLVAPTGSWQETALLEDVALG
jgi:hypothetical protein